MVAGKVAQRYVVQRLVKAGKPFIQRYVSKHYGEIAGSLAGIAISVSAGDYYGAISGISRGGSNESPPDRNPPFGYYPGDRRLNGKSNGAQYKALLSGNSYKYNNRRNNVAHSRNSCCCCEQKPKFRNRRR